MFTNIDVEPGWGIAKDMQGQILSILANVLKIWKKPTKFQRAFTVDCFGISGYMGISHAKGINVYKYLAGYFTVSKV